MMYFSILRVNLTGQEGFRENDSRRRLVSGGPRFNACSRGVPERSSSSRRRLVSRSESICRILRYVRVCPRRIHACDNRAKFKPEDRSRSPEISSSEQLASHGKFMDFGSAIHGCIFPE